MPLSPGTTLGPYQIDAPLGAGGMGEVYKATDTRLERTVAIKVLPEHVAADPDLKQRFEREAKTISSLNHPHICTLHDIGSQDGIDFLVMEYLDGETLAQRLEKGALPLDQALQIAIEIADALDKAHRQGIVHRDLKPGNIMLTKAGAKLLDFGLAKLKPVEVSPGESALPTQSAGLTGEGSILGTLQYMAPEQLEGKRADHRTDIFAFGTTVYEMVTGKKAFRGDNQASLISAILKDEAPSVTALQPMSSATLDYIVKTCLGKDLDDRWQSAGDVGRQLRGILQSGSHESVPGPVVALPPALSWRRAIPWSVGMAGGVVVAALALWSLVPHPTIVRDAFTVSLPPDTSLPAAMDIVAALSPDGRTLVYVGRRGNASQLYRRPLDQLDAVPIANTDGARNPFFSPDGEWVGFVVGDTLKKVPVVGGTSVTIGTGPEVINRLSWGHDNTIWFGGLQSGRSRVGLYRVPAAGGTPELVTTPGIAHEGVIGHLAPQPLPIGKAILYTADRSTASDTPRSSVAVYLPDTGEHRILAEGERPWFASSGHVVFSEIDSGTLWALPFDADRLKVTGDAVLVREGVRVTQRGEAEAYLGADGTLIYVPEGAEASSRTLVWVDREGYEEPVAAAPRPYEFPRLSPDGTRVVTNATSGRGRDLWIHDLIRGFDMPLTNDDEGGDDWVALWTPDSERIVYNKSSAALGGGAVMRRAADGTGDAETLIFEPGRLLYPSSWSADGTQLLLQDWNPDGPTGWDISMVVIDGEHRLGFLLQTEDNEAQAEVSPDGRWMAYVSEVSGREEVYVTEFPHVGRRRVQVSTDGGQQPAWSSDGSELFYRKGIECLPNKFAGVISLEGCRKAMMSVAVETEPTFTPGTPAALFEETYFTSIGRHYDYDSDTQRFMMIKADPSLHQIHVVRNWVEELRERAPGR